MSVLSMLHRARVSGWHSWARAGIWASSSRTLAMVPPVVMKRIFFLFIRASLDDSTPV